MKAVSMAIAKDLVDDILSQPPDIMDDLNWNIRILLDIISMHSELSSPEVLKWIQDAQDILFKLD